MILKITKNHEKWGKLNIFFCKYYFYLSFFQISDPDFPKMYYPRSLFPKIMKIPKNHDFLKKPKITKNWSQNVKSRIPIRDSKFLAYSYTHTSSFIFEKNHILKTPFLWNVAKSGFWKFLTFWKMWNSERPLGDPKMG